MSKRVQANVQCNACGHTQAMALYRSLWVEDGENRALMLNDQINLFRCDRCGHAERLEFPFLATNAKRQLAIWYEPYHDPLIDKDVDDYKRTMGASSFYSKAPRVPNWEAFKSTFLAMEKAGPQAGQEVHYSAESKSALRGFIDSLKGKR